MAYNGKLADPDFRHQRAKKAARARTTVDYHIAQVVDAWPTLTETQRSRLAQLLPPARASRKEAA